MPQHPLLTLVMRQRPVEEAPALLRAVDGPAGEAAGHLDHVLLRVAPILSQDVQLHDLPGVVLVEPQLAAFLGPGGQEEVRNPLTSDGYRVWARCSCGARFERWVTPADADDDLLRSALLAFEK